MQKVLTLKTFARKLGYSTSRNKEFKERLRLLKALGTVKVQQSGFMGHSCAHHKIVVYKGDLSTLEQCRQEQKIPKEERIAYFCPYCGRVISIYEEIKNLWRFGYRRFNMLLECRECLGTFQISTKSNFLISRLKEILEMRRKIG